MTPDRSARAPVTTVDAGGAGGGPRLLVPDVLRGVALLAMLIAHAVPFLPERPAALAVVMANINDLASPLFALVMGVSAQLVLQRTVRSGIPFMLFQQIIRGMILIGLGMILSEWGTWVAIVLSYLGVLLIVGAPLLFLSSRWLAVVAVGLAVVSDPLNAWARSCGAVFPGWRSSRSVRFPACCRASSGLIRPGCCAKWRRGSCSGRRTG